MKILQGRLLMKSSIKEIASSDTLSKLLPLGKNLLIREFTIQLNRFKVIVFLLTKTTMRGIIFLIYFRMR